MLVSTREKDRLQREVEAYRALLSDVNRFSGSSRLYQWEISARNGGKSQQPGYMLLVNRRTDERTGRMHWKTIYHEWHPSLQAACEMRSEITKAVPNA